MPPVALGVDQAKRFPLRFDRQEWSGAFGDLGTDLPLIVGMILAAKLDATSVFTAFGLLQVFTALAYRLPMPVQPLKAMASIVIAQQIPAQTVYGGGLAIGLMMLALTLLGLIDWIDRLVPKTVVRGIQCGLGLQLTSIALGRYMPANGFQGWLLAAAGFLVALILRGRPRVPVALLLTLVGASYGLVVAMRGSGFNVVPGIHLPQLTKPSWGDISAGLLLLALPQLPLSIANSILATRQLVQDLFPDRALSARRIASTYAVMNLVNPFVGGIPTCHGSGGMAGHYAFGARTGGSVIIYGATWVILGVIFGPACQKLVESFPLPLLGVLLLFEGLTLLVLLSDLAHSRKDFTLALLVGLISNGVPYGFLIGLVVGVAIHLGMSRGWVPLAGQGSK